MGMLRKIKTLLLGNELKNKNIYNNEINNFLDQDSYISVKDKNMFIKNMQLKDLLKLNTNDDLKQYCKQNKLNYYEYMSLFEKIKTLDVQIKKHNDEYIENHLSSDKEYLDNILKEFDPNVKLDEEQRRVVLSDEDYTLVVAGAGAGKTTTVSAKVKFLVEKKNINPKDILVISYTNKAVKELRERINKDLKIYCPITTFHSTGHEIIKKNNEEKRRIVSDNYLYKYLVEFLNNLMEINKDLVKKIILFYGYYIDIEEPKDIEQFKMIKEFTRYRTLESQIIEANDKEIKERDKRLISILSEVLKSHEEVHIANFLYLNGIHYTYEKPYPFYVKNLKRPYLPDFTIEQNGKVLYLEHFGITEDLKNDMYSKEKLERYISNIELKKLTHKKNNTKLIYTYSKYNDGTSTLDKLKEILINEGIEFNPISEEEVYKQLSKSKDNTYYNKFLKLLLAFINP